MAPGRHVKKVTDGVNTGGLIGVRVIPLLLVLQGPEGGLMVTQAQSALIRCI